MFRGVLEKMVKYLFTVTNERMNVLIFTSPVRMNTGSAAGLLKGRGSDKTVVSQSARFLNCVWHCFNKTTKLNRPALPNFG